MLLCVLIISIIVLLDICGSSLSPENVSLLYMTSTKSNEDFDDTPIKDEDFSAKDMAMKAQDKIFKG